MTSPKLYMLNPIASFNNIISLYFGMRKIDQSSQRYIAILYIQHRSSVQDLSGHIG